LSDLHKEPSFQTTAPPDLLRHAHPLKHVSKAIALAAFPLKA
jgi:hypothetical protein